MYTLLEVLKRLGYRENLSCKNVSVLNLEIDLHKDVKQKLIDMGVNVSNQMEDARDDDPLKYHSLYTTGITKEYLKDAYVSLFPNDPFAYQEWLNRKYQIVGMSVSAISLIDDTQKLMSESSYLVASAGNRAEQGVYETKKFFDLVGACDNELKIRPYSSYEEIGDVDYCGIDGFEYMGVEHYGTSFSRPLVGNILVGQLCQLFYNQFGFHMTPMQIHHFVKRNCIDIDDEGYDIKSGAGLFMLPTEDQMDFFNSVEITDELLNCVKVVGNNDTIFITDYGVDFSENSNNVANLIAYITRRKMADNNIELDRVVFDVSSVEKYFLRDLISNSSMFVDKLERGEA